jgi:hypothetical protein
MGGWTRELPNGKEVTDPLVKTVVQTCDEGGLIGGVAFDWSG